MIMVINRKCKDCNKLLVCSWSKIIDKFDDEIKKSLIGVTIKFENCSEFDNVKDLRKNYYGK